MTTLIFVRHGQSESNLTHRFTGQGDTPLTELGLRQAERTAILLRDCHIDRIYSSDLKRSMQTAERTASLHGLDIIPRQQLREIYAGEWESREYDDIKTNYPKSYGIWLSDIGRAHPNGGESVRELAQRVYREVDRIANAHPNQTVAIFTHALPIRMLCCRWHEIDPENAREVPFCSNASVSAVQYVDDGRCELLCYGYDEHQGADATTLPSKYV